jgi:hypothetical protein
VPPLQVFESSRVLGKQGWRFTMQASMLEIYNEDYKDLLARKKLPDGKTHKVKECRKHSTPVCCSKCLLLAGFAVLCEPHVSCHTMATVIPAHLGCIASEAVPPYVHALIPIVFAAAAGGSRQQRGHQRV